MDSVTFNSSDEDIWYFGSLDRKRTQEKLLGKIHGTFLVRDSKTCPGDLVLSVSENTKVSHYIINRKNKKLIIGEQEFNSMPELLEFYKVHYLDTTTLLQPAFKDDIKEIIVDSPVILSNGNITASRSLDQLIDNAGFSSTKLEVKALFDFKGNDAEDLAFKKGEILEIVAKPEENWWTARNSSGRIGQVPVPYIEKIANRKSQPPLGPIKNPDKDHRISLPDIRNFPIYAEVTLRRVPSAYDPSALALEVGDIVRVTKMRPNGQWEGTIKGKTGYFPFTHVQVLENYNP